MGAPKGTPVCEKKTTSVLKSQQPNTGIVQVC